MLTRHLAFDVGVASQRSVENIIERIEHFHDIMILRLNAYRQVITELTSFDDWWVDMPEVLQSGGQEQSNIASSTVAPNNVNLPPASTPTFLSNLEVAAVVSLSYIFSSDANS